MADDSSSAAKSGTGMSLSAILTTLQQGVVALNNVTQTMSSIFPST